MHFRLFEWVFMPFQLSNTPSTLESNESIILKPSLPLHGQCIDDILVYIAFFSKHLSHLYTAIYSLHEKHLCAKLKN